MSRERALNVYCNSIVEAHGGKMEVKVCPRKGSNGFSYLFK